MSKITTGFFKKVADNFLARNQLDDIQKKLMPQFGGNFV
jgi:hypothetical protein